MRMKAILVIDSHRIWEEVRLRLEKALQVELAQAAMTCPPKTDPHVKLERWIDGRQVNE